MAKKGMQCSAQANPGVAVERERVLLRVAARQQLSRNWVPGGRGTRQHYQVSARVGGGDTGLAAGPPPVPVLREVRVETSSGTPPSWGSQMGSWESFLGLVFTGILGAFCGA
eukprot:scaffold2017_cov71-Phaeocystis_antarctica.AAC.3